MDKALVSGWKGESKSGFQRSGSIYWPLTRGKPPHVNQGDMKNKVYASSREQWHSWLSENHARTDEVWLVFYKKHTGKPSVSYPDSVAEALCFGWIDGKKKSIDEKRYAYRFTPRRAGSKWSPRNVELAQQLIHEGRMTTAGLEAFEHRVSYDQDLLRAIESDGIPLQPEIENRLKANEKAWDNFNRLAPGYRKQYVGWLQNAKRPETREKRIREAISLLEKNEKPGMK